MGQEINCTHCGVKIPSGADFCVKCARPIKTGKSFCKYCGEALKEEQVFCLKCGKAIKVISNTQQPGLTGRSRLAAILFAFLLGGIGAHKFYLGDIVLGIVYLLFCWTFIPAIIALIEGIFYLTMSDDEFNKKYNKANN